MLTFNIHVNESNDFLRILVQEFNSYIPNEFPKCMKLAVVQPLYKSKCHTQIVNYRPISLLHVISKILEKLWHKRMVKFLESVTFYEGQYGFRANRSCRDAILDQTGNIVENVDKGNYVVCVL